MVMFYWAMPIFGIWVNIRKLSHVVYKYGYHMVWVPKYRLRILKGEVKALLEDDVRMFCEWKVVMWKN